MAKSDIGYTGPGLLGLRPGLSVPTQAPDLAGQLRKGVKQRRQQQQTQETANVRTASVLYNPQSNQYAVGNKVFDVDDYASALETEPLLKEKMPVPQEGGWVPLNEQVYRESLQRIKKPTKAELLKRGVGRGVDTMQALAGTGLEFVADTGVADVLAGGGDLAKRGQDWLKQKGRSIRETQETELAKTAPFARDIFAVSSTDEFGDWMAANFGEALPSMLTMFIPGAVVGKGVQALGATSSTLSRIGAALSGKELTKFGGIKGLQQATKTAVDKKAKGIALDDVDKAALRTTSGLVGIAAGTGAAGAVSYGMGTLETYGEFQQLAEEAGQPIAEDAVSKSLLAGAAYPLTDILPAGAILRPFTRGSRALKKGKRSVAAGALTGGITAGVAEGTGEALQEAATLAATGQNITTEDNIKDLVRAFAAGAGFGGPFGAVGGITQSLRDNKATDLLNKGEVPAPAGSKAAPTSENVVPPEVAEDVAAMGVLPTTPPVAPSAAPVVNVLKRQLSPEELRQLTPTQPEVTEDAISAGQVPESDLREYRGDGGQIQEDGQVGVVTPTIAEEGGGPSISGGVQESGQAAPQEAVEVIQPVAAPAPAAIAVTEPTQVVGAQAIDEDALYAEAERDVDAGDIGDALKEINDYETKANLNYFITQLDRQGVLEDLSDVQTALRDSDMSADDVREMLEDMLIAARTDAVQQRYSELLQSRQDVIQRVRGTVTAVAGLQNVSDTVRDFATKNNLKVVHQDGTAGLMLASGSTTGDPLYVPYIGDQYWVVDVSAAKFPAGIDPRIVKALKDAKKNLEDADAAAHLANPFIDFNNKPHYGSTISETTRKVIEEWKPLLGLGDTNIYVTTPNDVIANRDNIHGPDRKLLHAIHEPDQLGWAVAFERDPTTKKANYIVVVKDGLTAEQKWSVIAHELGHIHQREVFSKAPTATQNAIEAEYRTWLASQQVKGRTFGEYAESIKTRGALSAAAYNPNLELSKVTDLDYWLSFNEWFADQTSRWAMSSDKPLGVVEKFFKMVATNLRRFYETIRGAGYLPNETFKQYMDGIAYGTPPAPGGIIPGTFMTIQPSRANPQLKAGTKARLIENLPDALQTPVMYVTDFFGGMTSRAVGTLALGNQLFDYADSIGLKSGRRLEELFNARGALVENIQEAFVKWAEDHSRLPANLRGVGKSTVNGLIEAMTRSGKWAYTPTHFVGEDALANKLVVVDPALRERYEEMPSEAQEIVRRAFKLNHQLLKNLQRTIVESASSEYDVLIKNATDVATRTRLRNEKAKSLQRFDRMLKMKAGLPYAPLTRYGDYIVVGKSNEYVAAERNGDTELLSKLKSDPNHYFADFAETRAQAARMEREIAGIYANTDKFAKNKAKEDMYGGRDMLMAFQRIDKLLTQLPGKSAQPLREMLVDIQVSAMSSTSIRKAELRRLNVASGDMDMVQNILTRARASSHFIGAISKNRQIVDALEQMEQEVKNTEGSREDRQNAYNALLARYADSLDSRATNSLADKLTGFTALWMLGFSPSYYVQQAMQNVMLTAPTVAAQYGYGRTYNAFKDGYAQVGKAWSDTALTEQLNIEKVSPEYRNFAYFLSESGQLDVGINKEIGEISSDGDGFLTNGVRRVANYVRAMTRKIEAINRLSAGIAMYQLALKDPRLALRKPYSQEAYKSYVEDFKKLHPTVKSPMTEVEFGAAMAAKKLILDTHGDYSMNNAPLFMRTGVGRVVLQFKKFSLMVAGLYIRETHNLLNSTKTPEERWVAAKMLAFITGHAAIVGGAMALPAMAIFEAVYNSLSEDDEERGDMQRDLRTFIGDPALADLLMHGVPTLAGVNLSGTLGLGTILSIAPFTEMPSDRETWAKFVTAALGPFIGGIVPDALDGVRLMMNGNIYKGLEMMVPRGLRQASKTIRESVEGETSRSGDILTTPINIPRSEAFWGSLGFMPEARAKRNFNRNQFYLDQKFYAERTATLKRKYIAAVEAKDREEIQRLRREWKLLQVAKRRKGLRKQPLRNLLRAPREKLKRERQTLGGVPFTRATRGQVEEITRVSGE